MTFSFYLCGRLRLKFGCLAMLATAFVLSAAPVLATTRTVNNLNDTGPGSLRQLISESAANDTINFSVTGTITLTSGELLINKNLTISGPGANVLTVRRSTAGGTSVFRIFHIAFGNFNVTMSGLTIANGDSSGVNRVGGIHNESTAALIVEACAISGNNGDGILNGGGAMTIINSTVSGNTSSFKGGGIGNSGTMTITNSTVSGNTSSFEGGGIYNGGTMTITNSVISDNTLPGQGVGGGIFNDSGSMTILNSTISGNTAGSSTASQGGGICNFSGTVTITNSTISGNTSSFDGGGICNFSGTVIITNSTISGNTSSSEGGGIFNSTSTVTIINSTISSNTASSGGGGGICNSGTLNVTNSTISSNTASSGGGGGIFNFNTVTFRNSIIAKNTARFCPDFRGALTSNGFNLIGNSSGLTITPTTGDQIGTPGSPIDPLLGQLADNGGPTKTQALLSGSPAINTGDPNAPARDQRGYLRQNAPDIGAFEFGATIPVTLANISTRAFVQTGDNVMIGGFIITGGGQKKVIVRAIGPSLVNYGITNPLQNPTLELHDHTGAVIAFNDNWMDAPNKQEIIDSGLAPTNNLESAILTTLDPGDYTAIVRSVNNGTGIGLVEAYDIDPTTAGSKLGNISTRAFVQTGDNVMIGGLIVTGPDSENVIVRAIGPSLVNFGISNALADPFLELHDANGALITSNDNWKDTQHAEIEATGLAPSNDLESAIVRTLTPGNYTAIVSGRNNTIGVALVEVYGLN